VSSVGVEREAQHIGNMGLSGRNRDKAMLNRRMDRIRTGPGLLTILLAGLCIVAVGACAEQRGSKTNLVVTPKGLRLPDLPEGAFVGNLGSTLLVGGGLRADGSLSDIVYVGEPDATNW